jgi:Leucine-rich repeat (LRR) protein
MKKYFFSLAFLSFYAFNTFCQSPVPIIKGTNLETIFINKKGGIAFTLPIGHRLVVGDPPYLHFNPAHNQGLQALDVFKGGKAIVVEEGKNVYWVNEKGEKIKDFGPDYTSMTNLIEGYHMAWKRESQVGYKTINIFLDKNGTPAFENKSFKSADPFSEGFAAVQLSQSKEWCYIDTTGNKAFDIAGLPADQISNISSFKNGIAKVYIKIPGSRYGTTPIYINTKGEKIIDIREKYGERKLSHTGDFADGLLALAFKSKGDDNRMQKNMVVLNKKGEEVFNFKNIERIYNLTDGRFIIMQTTAAGNSTYFVKYFISTKEGAIEELSLGEDTYLKEISYTGEFLKLGVKKKEDIKTYNGIYELNPLKELFLTDRYIIAFNQQMDLVLLGDKRRSWDAPHRFTLQKLDGTIIWETPVGDQLFTNIEEAVKYKNEVTKYYQTEITDFEKGLFELKNLEELMIKRIRITELPKDFTKLKKLKKLELIGISGLKSIPKELCELKHLEYLSLSEFSFKPEGLEYFILNTSSLKNIQLEGIRLSDEFYNEIDKVNPQLRIEEEEAPVFMDQEIDIEEEIDGGN